MGRGFKCVRIGEIRMISRKKFIILVLAACVLGGSLIFVKSRPKSEENISKPREHTVVVGDIIVGIDGSGEIKLEGSNQYFTVDGTLEELAVKKGQRVSQGDFIGKLSDKRINNELEELRLDLAEKEYNLEQLKKQRNSIEDKDSQEYSNMQSQVHTSQIEVDKLYKKIDDLEYNLENLCVYANTTGVIVDIGYEIGSEVTKLKPIVVVGDEKSAYLDVLLSQTDIAKIQEEQGVNVTLEAYPDVEIKGKVVEKSYVNSTQGENVDYRVRAILELNDLEVYQGMTGEIKFVIKGKEDVLQVPNKFIYIKDNKQMVKVLANNEIQEREIKTGFSDGKFTEILEGLQGGETVIEER